MSLSKEKSAEQAALFQPIIHIIDATLPAIDTDYLDRVAAEMNDQLRRSESISFMIGGNNFGEQRRRCEIEMLVKIIDLYKTRKRHYEQMHEAAGTQRQVNQVKELIENLTK